MLDISPVLLLVSAIVFLLVLARLNSCLYKPLMKHMDERDKSIKNDLASVQGNSAEIEGMLSQANSLIAKAKVEAALTRDKASSEANKIAQSKLNGAKSDIEEKYNSFIKTLKVEKESLKQELSASMPLFKDSLKAKINSI